MNQSSNPIIVTHQFSNSVQEVWEAITVRDKMVQWFFDNIPEFKAEKGFKTGFSVFSGDKEFIHCWEIIEVIPYKKIVYDWTYEKFSGQGYVHFNLSEEQDGCKLELVNIGIDSFPNDLPEFTRESCKAGWEYFIKQQLANYLNT